MTKFANDLVMDAAFDFVIAEAERLVVLSSFPATYAAVAAATLADDPVVGGDFAKSDGDTNGRKVRVAQQSAVPIDVSGTATHVGIVDDAGTRILLVTECTPQVLTAGGTVTIPVWDEEIGDPT